MLREWQKRCADAALKKYLSGSPHFLCLASPGAGKTVMAAEIAKRMLARGLVDLVLCFAPSSAVVSSIESTFSRVLSRNFNGGLGAAGAAFTYHSLMYLDKRFWDALRQHRLLVIFDEIHHCSGNSLDNANAWGGEILTQVQHCARYTLALTGTPWRTDNVPVALASYTDPGGKICCDYVYGLHDAIIDGVCRKPAIVLINSQNLCYASEGKSKHFGSISDLLNTSLVTYQSLLRHPETMKYVINAGCQKLSEIRQTNSDAGGLMIASSVEHAYELLNILKNEFAQTATIVTYQDKDALSKIALYRQGTTEWIVSVGMISEGTDIPRLQVCCHLSAVKTELYFRQVLGRILRVNQDKNQEAWLFTLATDELTLFSERLAEDLPADYEILHLKSFNTPFSIDAPFSSSRNYENHCETEHYDEIDLKLNLSDKPTSVYTHSEKSTNLDIGGLYQRVIDAFLFSNI
ncbi:DEAD/DEAH box helicase [Enterobacter kobei]|uniref:DEAD/DEAH box helicase n=1 Tax=Enterobacter kobei TaxID=208224 RepID=UPI003CF62EE1